MSGCEWICRGGGRRRKWWVKRKIKEKEIGRETREMFIRSHPVKRGRYSVRHKKQKRGSR